MRIDIKKISGVVIGSAILALGISLALLSGHGGDAVSVFNQGVSNTLGITIGMATILFHALFLIPVILVEKKHLGIGSILSPIVCAIIIDAITLHITIPVDGIGSILLVLIGVVLAGIGLALYSHADAGKACYDAFTLAVVEKHRLPLWVFKSTCDLTLGVIGFLLGGVIGWGPVLAILMVGPILQATLKLLNRQAIVNDIV